MSGLVQDTIPNTYRATCTREICKKCYKEVTVGFSVPNEIWNRVIGNSDTIRCVACFTEKADELEVQWDEDIKFYPVSKVTFGVSDR